jgi:transposase
MLHAGLDLSRKKVDVCLLSDEGEPVAEFASPSDLAGLRALARRVREYREPVRGVIESMTGARFCHDTLDEHGWDVLIADAQRVKGLAPIACKTDRIDARVPALLSHRDPVPGIGWILAYTIAAEIGDIGRFRSPTKPTGYTGLCPRVSQSGEKDRRGPLSKHGPRCLRWAMLEASMHALRHPAYTERYQRNKRRLGKQRGAKVAQVDIARRLTEAIWHMLTRNQPFAPKGAAFRLAA